MNLLCTDLDNTLIYSYKHDIGNLKQCVEVYQGRDISFITERTFQLLNQIRDLLLITPVTTRTEEQYRRIDLGIGSFQYALVCNGGILLEDGKRDVEWYLESLAMVQSSRQEMEKGFALLEKESKRYFELRYINELFLFTKCSDPLMVEATLKEQLHPDLVDVFHNGDKIYIVPKNLTKGNAIKRLRKKLQPERIIAAGDSEFDRSMLCEADIAYIPREYEAHYGRIKHAVTVNNLFSDGYLEQCLNLPFVKK